jgi:hypothetical protein
VKTVKLRLDSFGSFLGMEKGCFVLRDKKGRTKKYPIFETEIGEIVLQSGNLVSTGALTSCRFWGVICWFMTFCVYGGKGDIVHSGNAS